jgi:hypothetical protein
VTNRFRDPADADDDGLQSLQSDELQALLAFHALGLQSGPPGDRVHRVERIAEIIALLKPGRTPRETRSSEVERRIGEKEVAIAKLKKEEEDRQFAIVNANARERQADDDARAAEMDKREDDRRRAEVEKQFADRPNPLISPRPAPRVDDLESGAA